MKQINFSFRLENRSGPGYIHPLQRWILVNGRKCAWHSKQPAKGGTTKKLESNVILMRRRGIRNGNCSENYRKRGKRGKPISGKRASEGEIGGQREREGGRETEKRRWIFR